MRRMSSRGSTPTVIIREGEDGSFGKSVDITLRAGSVVVLAHVHVSRENNSTGGIGEK
jgi:hypothetical protein